MKVTKILRSNFFAFLICAIFSLIGCGQAVKKVEQITSTDKEHIVVGANRTEKYLPQLKGKNIGIVANNTSVIFKDYEGREPYIHLVDSLLSLNINIVKVFAPEHGFRGKADAGEVIVDSRDAKTNLPVVSLYGSNVKPTAEQLRGIDAVMFDIQDVGVRFYTYLSTMHYIMEACAENGIPVIVLDRPNPNGHYIDGPVVEKGYESFVGLHPVPIVYGMTIGEYAKMINGEKWLHEGLQCDLTVIPLVGYTYNSSYSLPLRPSPNLPNDKAINLYASLCLFEGTNVSCGRGTERQFQIFGSPYLLGDTYDFTFVPKPNFGSKTPKYMNEECFGLDLTKTENLDRLNFTWLLEAYNGTNPKDKFFNNNKHFDRLAGTPKLKEQIIQGKSIEEIRATWNKGLEEFKNIRDKYLMYQ
ncbi:DUF1343 domain-containing protein [Arenibacter sp. 6A1]|uniref:exo-beta-N-acetylmuramidase NamZ family protein n=1 Tax=Arenibacter sp. 6A1 TaxID=2720391 RepID=UPI001447B3DF|nr:DUF1343 domain-containing protein [Arenibacter sp. 6A1]NKI27743.1 DUF1343 domain-containing protein [Arenibacter sp. 6A1]